MARLGFDRAEVCHFLLFPGVHKLPSCRPESRTDLALATQDMPTLVSWLTSISYLGRDNCAGWPDGDCCHLVV